MLVAIYPFLGYGDLRNPPMPHVQTAKSEPIASMPVSMNNLRVDLGCGPNKRSGCLGIDSFAYPNVDLVQDLDAPRWDLPDSCCKEIWGNQMIDHVRNLRAFFSEIHRVAQPGCKVWLCTPHFSSHNSWADPTHIHHLSVTFAHSFTSGYLTQQLPKFKVTREKITFGSFGWTWPARLICGLFGTKLYEKRFCWMFPASSIVIEMEVIK
jgi:hypothetical protein